MAEPSMAPVEVVELLLPPRPEVVSVARLVVGALVAATPGFDDERGADVRLAISEACTNAIQAQGMGALNAEPIQLRCSLGDGRIELAVTDHGQGFDPAGLEAHPGVTTPERLEYEGGLGIPLIRLLSDAVAFDVTESGTTVVMEFRPRAGETGTVSGLGLGNGSGSVAGSRSEH